MKLYRWCILVIVIGLISYNSTLRKLGSEREVNRQLHEQIDSKNKVINKLEERERVLSAQFARLVTERDKLRVIYEEDIALFKKSLVNDDCSNMPHGDAVSRLLNE